MNPFDRELERMQRRHYRPPVDWVSVLFWTLYFAIMLGGGFYFWIKILEAVA